MTNREKALVLSSMNRYEFSVEESNAAYNAALAMAEWKDEDFAQKKQALIDKACEWIRYNNENGGCLFDGWEEDFKQAMKGGNYES